MEVTVSVNLPKNTIFPQSSKLICNEPACNMCYNCVCISVGVRSLLIYCVLQGLSCEDKLTWMNVVFQVEQQFSHKFTVTVVRAESVTKGALGDLCESHYYILPLFVWFSHSNILLHFFQNISHAHTVVVYSSACMCYFNCNYFQYMWRKHPPKLFGIIMKFQKTK